MRNYLLADRQARPVTSLVSLNYQSPSDRHLKNCKSTRPPNMTPRLKDKNPSLHLAPIDLSEPQVVNQVEEKLRLEKEKQLRQREEMRQKELDRQEKQLEMQNNLQKQIKESKTQNY